MFRGVARGGRTSSRRREDELEVEEEEDKDECSCNNLEGKDTMSMTSSLTSVTSNVKARRRMSATYVDAS